MNRNLLLRNTAATLLAGASLFSAVSFAQTTKNKPSVNSPVQTASVTVTDSGFSPAKVTLKAGVHARVTFKRTSKTTCATSVVMPDYNVKKDLPLGKPVVVSFTPKKAGTFTFACGMNMVKGSVVVR